MPPFKCNNILIVRTDRIGDVVLTTPVFKALRGAYPFAKISVLVTPNTYDLVCGNPYIDEALVDDRDKTNKGLLGALRLARQVRKRQFDTVFIMHTKRRYNAACFLAGIPVRVGYQDNKFGFLLTHPVKDQRFTGQKHEAQYCLDLLKEAGITSSSLDLLVPKQKDAEIWANQWFETNRIGLGDLIAIHPGASDVTKMWPRTSFAQLILKLANRYNLKIVLLGGPETAAISADIKRLGPAGILDLTGQITVGQMASLLRRSRLLISNDSGPAHVGAAVGINVITLFLRDQPGINAKRWCPLGPKARLLANKATQEIRLNKQGSVTAGKADSIKVEDVLDLVEQIFKEDNQSVFYW